MSKVLVTDASERSSLAIIRSLGSKGIKIIAGDSNSINSGFLSKYCYSRIRYPSPLENKFNFCESLLNYVKKNQIDLLIPVTDNTILPIIDYRSEFEKYVKLALPSTESLLKTVDKWETFKIAKEVGVPVPNTVLLDRQNIENISEQVKYPCVIKPRTKLIWINGVASSYKISPYNYVTNKQDFIIKTNHLTSKNNQLPNNFFMVQDFVSGEGFGAEYFLSYGAEKAVFLHKRLREYPITGGASTLRISSDKIELISLGLKLLKKLNWDGVAMVEFKVNEKTDDIKLMEINGRFWGSLSLAINSGVDFPYLLYRKIVEGRNDAFPAYKVGLKQRWLIPGDILWLLSSMSIRDQRLNKLLSFFASFSYKDDILSINDPSPTIGAVNDSLKLLGDVISNKKSLIGEIL